MNPTSYGANIEWVEMPHFTVSPFGMTHNLARTYSAVFILREGSKRSESAADVSYCLNYSRCLKIIDTFR